MPDSTFEEAKRCPKCKEPGVDTGNTQGHLRGATRGAVVHEIKCVNSRCRWYNTSWVVQTNPDGTVPPPTTSRQKSFPRLPERDQEVVDRQMQRLLDDQLS